LELSKIDAAQREAQLQHNLGVTTNKQMLEQETQFENDRNALKAAALQKKLALVAMDPTENVAKIQANLNEQLALETAHDVAVDQLRIKSVEQSNTEWKSMFNTNAVRLRQGDQRIPARDAITGAGHPGSVRRH
jgi:hypothetical protein